MNKENSSQQTQKMSNSPLRVAVFGASGYSGSELLALLHHHAHFTVVKAYASERAQPVAWSSLAPQLAGRSSLIIEPFLGDLAALRHIDAAFLALPHEASAELAKQLIDQDIKVFDLSGAYRFKDATQFSATYGFTHPVPEFLPIANYMLAEYPQELSQLPLFSIPGCYPTAASLALLPVCESGLLAPASVPVITAISGVSGAGRAANLRTSFCEVSVQAYGVFQHRHRPEIANNLGRDVVFTPLIGPYPRGIVATCVAQLGSHVGAEEVHAVYQQAYAEKPFVRLVAQPPAVQHVAHTPFCDIFVAVEGQQLIVIAALDNLLKGAASQAVQAANRVFGLPVNAGFECHLGEFGGAE